MKDANPFRVLVVDDDRDILDLLQYNLSRESYQVKVVDRSDKALKVARRFSPDLIILDVMMPHPNGIELCREFRSMDRFRETYIFFLTAKSEHYYQQAALDTGGDDYIEKIVGLRSLTHKIHTVLRDNLVIRKSLRELQVGELVLNRRTGAVMLANTPITVSKPEFELLFFMAQNAGRQISREAFLHNIWGSEIFLADRSVEVYLQSLMKKLGERFIIPTGNGYRLSP